MFRFQSIRFIQLMTTYRNFVLEIEHNKIKMGNTDNEKRMKREIFQI